ncbi:Smr/MutS family protein [Polynucleobacter kasalickyi]|nr:Smr/MutS family protein [Polynucleobacter kasalickyi]
MKTHQIICAMCGNPRQFTLRECPYCGESDFLSDAEARVKAFTINLELGLPTIDEAFSRFEHYLTRLEKTGIRLLKVIHGQGSAGQTGKIKKAFRDAMDYGKWSNAIAEVYYGEALKPGLSGLEEFRKSHPSLVKGITLDMQGNSGITLLILFKDY